MYLRTAIVALLGIPILLFVAYVSDKTGNLYLTIPFALAFIAALAIARFR